MRRKKNAVLSRSANGRGKISDALMRKGLKTKDVSANASKSWRLSALSVNAGSVRNARQKSVVLSLIEKNKEDWKRKGCKPKELSANGSKFLRLSALNLNAGSVRNARRKSVVLSVNVKNREG